MTKEELSLELKKSIAKANRKLNTLDKQGINSFASDITVNNIKNFYNDDNKKRFSYNKNMNYNEMEKLLKIADNFNTSKGSTKKGIESYIKAREKNFNVKGVSSEQLSNMYNILNSDNYKKLVEIYKDSNQVVDAIISANLQSYDKDSFNIDNRLKKAIEKHKGLSSDELYLDDLVETLKVKPRKKSTRKAKGG